MTSSPPPKRGRRLLAVFAGLAVLGAVLGGTFYGGFHIGAREVFPFRLIERVENKLFGRRTTSKAPAQAEAPTTVATHLVQIDIASATVDTERAATISNPGAISNPIAANGGGLTEFGGDILLLPYSGMIHAASGTDDIRATGLRAPDNNRAAYIALTENPEFDAYNIRPDYLRYNDLAYFRTDTAHGLIASYTEYLPDETCSVNTLARLDFAADVTSIDQVTAAPEDWQVIFQTTPCLPFKTRNFALEGHMASGKIVVSETGTLYLSSGDFHFDGMRSDGPLIAQDPAAQYGKVLAMDLDGGNVRTVSMGHRNVQGFTRTTDGTLFTVEHGPKGGDEINRLVDGANFGWPLESFGITYAGSPMPDAVSFGRHDSFDAPIYVWVPSVAPAGMDYIDGVHPAWDGDLLVGTLIDRSLHRVRLQGGRALYTERIEIGERVRDVHVAADGRIVLWTDSQQLWFLTVRDSAQPPRTVAQYADFRRWSPAEATRLEAEIGRCSECHSLQIGDHSKAPSLARIHGDTIASTSYDGYTDALKALEGTWTDEALAAFMSDPQGVAPGTAMPGLGDPELVDEVVGYLRYIDRWAY